MGIGSFTESTCDLRLFRNQAARLCFFPGGVPVHQDPKSVSLWLKNRTSGALRASRGGGE